MTRRFVLLDRDGTVIVEKNYLHDPDEVELYPGVGPALRRLGDLGFGLVVVTNQSGVGRGYFDMAAVDRVHERLSRLLAAEGVTVEAYLVCPHTPEAGCRCRKPAPGMVETAQSRFGFDPSAAFVIGDKAADVDLGKAVGATAILVRTGWGCSQDAGTATRADVVCADLAEASAWIERSLGGEKP